MPKRRHFRLAILGLLLLSACDTVRIPGDKGQPPLRNADYFLEAAKSSSGTRAALMRLSASELLLEDKRNVEALNVLEGLRSAPLSEEDRQKLYLLLAEAQLRLERPVDALVSLESVPRVSSLNNTQKKQRLQMQTQAYSMNFQPVEAAASLVALQSLLNSVERLANEDAIWKLLRGLNLDTLGAGRQKSTSAELNGWLDLAILRVRHGTDPDQLPRVLLDWRQRYASHPANLRLPEELSFALDAKRLSFNKLAVLLPMTGRLSSTGRVIRDGLMMAYYNDNSPTKPAEVVVYDSAQGDINLTYQRAVNEGADVIVGPLDRDQVQKIATLPTLLVPTLSLNLVENLHAPLSFYQFGLPIEDEAKQVATRALSSYRNAVIITNNDALGDRANVTMQKWFERGEGKILTSLRIHDEKQVEPLVEQALGVDASKRRAKTLQQILGIELGSQPRRRQDVEVILLAAKPSTARRIKPYLNFYFAQDIPVFATSYLYSGQPDISRDKDLTGIEFPEAPWLINADDPLNQYRREASALWPQATTTQARFFALGHDAYMLTPELQRLQAFADFRLQGLTGKLRMDKQGRIARSMPWAKFRDGRAVGIGMMENPVLEAQLQEAEQLEAQLKQEEAQNAETDVELIPPPTLTPEMPPNPRP